MLIACNWLLQSFTIYLLLFTTCYIQLPCNYDNKANFFFRSWSRLRSRVSFYFEFVELFFFEFAIVFHSFHLYLHSIQYLPINYALSICRKTTTIEQNNWCPNTVIKFTRAFAILQIVNKIYSMQCTDCMNDVCQVDAFNLLFTTLMWFFFSLMVRSKIRKLAPPACFSYAC